MLTYRAINALLVLLAMTATAIAIGYLQLTVGLEPCPLCIFQRIGLWAMGVFALLSLVFNPKSKAVRLLLWLGSMAGSLWGLGVAARHTWLHYSPSAVPTCGPGLGYWVETLPMSEVLTVVLAGNGDCAFIDWTLLGLSIPAWTMVLFMVIVGVLLKLLAKIIKNEP